MARNEPSRWLRIYGWVLSWSPEPFRRAYSQEAAQSLGLLMVAERQRAGRSAAAVVGLRAMLDAIRTVYRERRMGRRPRDPWCRGVAGDVRQILRSWRRARTFAATAIATMVLGVALNAGVFSFADGFLFRPLPFEHPDRLFDVLMRNDRVGALRAYEFHAIQAAEPDFAEFAEWGVSHVLHGPIEVDGIWEQVLAFDVSPRFADALRFDLHLGRAFRADEHGGAGVLPVWLSHSYWLRRFGGDPGVIGRRLRTRAAGLTHVEIVGVMPKLLSSFDLNNRPPQVVAPAPPPAPVPLARREFSLAFPMVRLAPGVSPEQAEVRLQAILRGVWAADGREPDNRTVRLVPLREGLVRGGRPTARLLLGIAVLIAVLVGVNLVHLMSARTMALMPELATRLALGATGWRLVRLRLTEGLLVSVAGLAGGLGAGWVLASVIAARIPLYPTQGRNLALVPMSFDARVVVFAAGLAGLLGLVGGLWPAVRLSRRSNVHLIRQPGAAPGGLRARASRVILGAEVAVATVIMVATALVGMNAWRHLNQPTGLDLDGRYRLSVALGETDARGTDGLRLLENSLRQRVAALPGVTAVGRGSWPVFGEATVSIDERQLPRAFALAKAADAGYFGVFGLRTLAGRTFDPVDEADVAVVDEFLARRLWPGREPLGQTLAVEGRSRRVIGVVTSVRQSLLAARGGFVYVPVETPDRPDIEFFLAAPAAPEGDVARAVAAAVVALAPSAHVEVDAVTFADVYLREVGEAQFHGPVVVALGAAALLLAGLGLFGVITYLSEQRHREVGIRVALGAGPSDVWAAVLRESVIPAGVGLAFGLAAAIWVNQALRSLVRGLQVADAVPMLIVTAVILVTAVIACVRPARRALRVDPVSVLRSE